MWKLYACSAQAPQWLLGDTVALGNAQFIYKRYLFYWDRYTLKRLLPVREDAYVPHFVGIDEDGNCQLLLPGVAKPWKWETADDFRQLFPEVSFDQYMEQETEPN